MYTLVPRTRARILSFSHMLTPSASTAPQLFLLSMRSAYFLGAFGPDKATVPRAKKAA